jgi:DNA-binding transcriptional LysR family regulator
MTLEQLRIFVAVAQREHVTQGARDLNLTQSASSAAIAALEARYATKLFDRIGRRILLTEAGRAFLDEARAVLARVSAAEAVLTDFAGMKVGCLNVAASQTVANYWLPSRLHQFRTLFPLIVANVAIGNTQTVATRVTEGLADLGIVEGVVQDSVLSVEPIAEDEMVLVVGKSHAWATRDSADPTEFDQTEWVLREQGSGTRAALEAVIKDAGLTNKAIGISMVLPSNEAVRAAIEAGAGAGVMSKLVVDRSIKAGVLVQLNVALPNRKFYLLRHGQRHASRITREFAALLGT